MRSYKLYREQRLNITLEEAWDFFSSPANLDLLTPPDMGFRITTAQPIPKMYENQIIEYKVSPILSIPIYWKTKITEVVDRVSFTDQQMKGPYKLWKHIHTFEDRGDHVMMTDDLTYALPLGFLGSIAHSLFVKNRLEEIFDYRYDKAEELFNQKEFAIDRNPSASKDAPPTSPPSTSAFAKIS
jgi:ligand-binding SRPBCC domain-containing protein